MKAGKFLLPLIIVIAATNRADVLDKALMRAGRFDRQIFVDLPDLNERKEIFEVHLKPLKVSKTLDVEFLSRQTPGFSGADIANVCNEAALIAARSNKKSVGKQDFLDAVDRIVGGLEKKNKIITKDGTEHEVDTIIYGTGFDTNIFISPVKIKGIGGRELDESWKSGAEAYRGVMVPYFPNFFILFVKNFCFPSSYTLCFRFNSNS